MPFILKAGNGFHHHKIVLIQGHIDSIIQIPNSKLNQIKIKEFEDEKMYFFKDTLRGLPDPADWSTSPISFGTVDFFISKELEGEAFENKSVRGTIVFNVPMSSDSNQNEKMTRQNFTVQEVESNRFGGTKACAPCTFLDSSNKLINYKFGDDYYFPIVTFADKENPMGNCYFSFCTGPQGMLNALNAKVWENYILGLDDDPFVDPIAKVLVHKELKI